MNKVEKLVNLMTKYPDLKVLPMVYREIVADDGWAYWGGSWGDSEIDEVYYGDERMYFRSTDEDELIDDKADIIFIDEYPNHQFLSDDESKAVETKAKEMVDKLEWEKVIVVRIEMP